MTLDSVSDLPHEISQIIFIELPPKTLLNCRRVSKSWKRIVGNDDIWKSKFQGQKSWEYYNDDSETDSWYELYKERYLLESNWKSDKFTKHKLIGISAQTSCVKVFKNWIITGSDDCTIKIWDNETYQCLKVLGTLNFFEKFRFSQIELSEFKEKSDAMTHFGEIILLDINDKYMVSGSFDDSCIIWKLPDFKAIGRLIIPEPKYLLGVALYNDYIVCCNGEYIGVWKSSLNLDNLEHQLKFNLHLRIKGEGWIGGIYVHNGIIYGKDTGFIKTWNIETGQIIQEFRFDGVDCFVVNDHYLFVNENYKLKVLGLQTNEIIILSDRDRVNSLFIKNNKLISVYYDFNIIKIWNLNDLKLFKKFEGLITLDEELIIYLNPFQPPVDSDSKRVAVLAPHGEVVIYDFTDNLRKNYLKHL